MNYSNSEFYKLTKKEQTFITVFKGWGFPSRENIDPLRVFNRLASKYPDQNHCKKLTDFDIWLRKNVNLDQYLTKPDQWIDWLDTMLRKSNKPKRIEIEKIPSQRQRSEVSKKDRIQRRLTLLKTLFFDGIAQLETTCPSETI